MTSGSGGGCVMVETERDLVAKGFRRWLMAASFVFAVRGDDEGVDDDGESEKGFTVVKK